MGEDAYFRMVKGWMGCTPLGDTLRQKVLHSGVLQWSKQDFLALSKESKKTDLRGGQNGETFLMEAETFRWVAKLVSPRFVFNFDAEVSSLCDLRGEEGVQQIEGVCLDEGNLVVVSQYAGESLHGNMERLSASQAEDLVAQMWAALRRIHGAGIVHRDLHARNICVCFESVGLLRLTVIDFGSSLTVDNPFTSKNTDFVSCYALQQALKDIATRNGTGGQRN